MTSQQVAPMDAHLQQRLIPVLDKIRALALRRGAGGLKDLSRALDVRAEGQSIKSNPDDFRHKLKSFGVVLSAAEFNLLALGFKDAVGYVQVGLFVDHLFGVLSERRKAVVDQAFDHVDGNKNGVIEIDDLAATFDASHNREFQQGHKSAEEVMREFLDCFTTSKEGRVTRQDFRAYYAAISPSIPHDGLFTAVVRSAWRLPIETPRDVAPAAATGAASKRNASPAAARSVSPVEGLSHTAAASGLGSSSPAHGGPGVTITRPKRVAGYTGHIPFAQERFGETFHSIESSAPELAKKPASWVVGSYVDHTNAFQRKGNKSNAHSFKMA